MSDGALIAIVLSLGALALIGWLAYLLMHYGDGPEDDS